MEIAKDITLRAFREKQLEDGAQINAGYMVLEPQVFDLIHDDRTVFEREPLEKLASHGELVSYSHYGFWQCMDTKLERDRLETLWANGTAPWKAW